ncbi:MAG: aminoacetone oxidase family FAD-binding enzyme [Lachnospiraceae bacterium]|nr:aminoacetone oxidase family FAD-binding enzyme [Lachnospiraceae bacterium]
MLGNDKNKKNNISEVIIIGAGPAGLMAAISAAREGAFVTVLEQKDKPLKKLYATGNGRCNFSNIYMDDKVYRGGDPEFALKIVDHYDRDDLLLFFHELGMMTKHIGDYIYPYNEQARSVADALLLECRRLGVKICCEERVVDITYKPENEDEVSSDVYSEPADEVRFEVKTVGRIYGCRKLILAVGGKASPAHGSDGNLNGVIKDLGHTIVKQYPALVPLMHTDKKLAKLAGVRVKCAVSLIVSGNTVSSERGEIIFNKDNISGIPVMQVSRYAAKAFEEGREVYVRLDLFPDETEEELSGLLRRAFDGYYDVLSLKNKDPRRDRSALEALGLCTNEKLAEYCLNAAGIIPRSIAGNVQEKKLKALAKLLKGLDVRVTGDAGFERAQVTAGGVDLSELTDDLGSKIIPGLYIAGELADVDGTCGGYNLQWAFSSGAIAGRDAGKSVLNR